MSIIDDFFNGINDIARGIGDFFGIVGWVMIGAVIIIVIVVILWIISLASGHGRG